MRRWLLLSMGIFCAMWGCSQTAPELMYSSAESQKAELADVKRQISMLPELSHEGANRHGYHSQYLDNAHAPAPVTIFLFHPRLIDKLVLIPATNGAQDGAKPGYGFPVEYRIECSLDGSEWDTLVEASGTDVGGAPVIHDIAPTEMRYLKIVPLTHYQVGDGLYAFALSEFMAMEQGINHALISRIEAISSLTRPPQWGPRLLCDGISTLGIRHNIAARTTAFGYQSLPVDDRDTSKWVQVDLGERKDIREVVLTPAAPADEPQADFGFPQVFEVQLSNDPEFSEGNVYRSQYGTRFAYDVGPSQRTVPLSSFGETFVRYVRIEAKRLNAVGRAPTEAEANSAAAIQYGFALAEIEIVENTPEARNVALGCDVVTSDGDQLIPNDEWSPAALTDGYACQGQLISLSRHIEQHVERDRLLRKQAALVESIASNERAVQRLSTGVAIGALTLLAGIVGLILRRQRRATARKFQQLRQQIARDLHDEIGSALATIRLASELAADSAADDELKTDLLQIRDNARDASVAMRDIVWLVDSSKSSSHELVVHLDKLAKTMLKGHRVAVEQNEKWVSADIPIEIRRNIVAAYKETLANVVKHAEAKHVRIKLSVTTHRFEFIVDDDGVGLLALRPKPREKSFSGVGSAEIRGDSVVDQATPAKDIDFQKIAEQQRGQNNLKARAKDSAGACEFASSETGGTRVCWSAWIP